MSTFNNLPQMAKPVLVLFHLNASEEHLIIDGGAEQDQNTHHIFG